ncbi:MAG TPA: VOC family protein [Thermoanaerobaculia bacterium]
MPHVTSHKPGAFCWIELMAADAAGARAFYTQLFGWSVNEIPMGDLGTYFIFQKEGKDVAAMYERTPDMAGVPPFWMSYIRVDDADAATEKAKSLGGTVHNGPMDVGSQGRMTVLADSQGAAFAIWQPGENQGIGIRDEDDSLCWNELWARDLDAAKQFYPALFGWGVKESPEYTEWSVGADAVGGMIPTHAPEPVPPFWLPYFAVADCDASVAQAQSAGAQVFAPPFDVPNVGRMAVLGDPQGAYFAVIKLNLAGHA